MQQLTHDPLLLQTIGEIPFFRVTEVTSVEHDLERDQRGSPQRKR